MNGIVFVHFSRVSSFCLSLCVSGHENYRELYHALELSYLTVMYCCELCFFPLWCLAAIVSVLWRCVGHCSIACSRHEKRKIDNYTHMNKGHFFGLRIPEHMVLCVYKGSQREVMLCHKLAARCHGVIHINSFYGNLPTKIIEEEIGGTELTCERRWSCMTPEREWNCESGKCNEKKKRQKKTCPCLEVGLHWHEAQRSA